MNTFFVGFLRSSTINIAMITPIMPRPLPSIHFPKYHSVSPYHSTLLSLSHWQASEIGHKHTHTHTQLNVSMSLSDFRIALAVLRLKQIWLQSLSQPGFGPKAGMHKSWMPGRTAFVHPWRRVSIPYRTQTWRSYNGERNWRPWSILTHAEMSMLQTCNERCTEGPQLGGVGWGRRLF